MILTGATEPLYKHSATVSIVDVLSLSAVALIAVWHILLREPAGQTRHVIREHRQPWCFYCFVDSESVRQRLFLSKDKVVSVPKNRWAMLGS